MYINLQYNTLRTPFRYDLTDPNAQTLVKLITDSIQVYYRVSQKHESRETTLRSLVAHQLMIVYQKKVSIRTCSTFLLFNFVSQLSCLVGDPDFNSVSRFRFNSENRNLNDRSRKTFTFFFSFLIIFYVFPFNCFTHFECFLSKEIAFLPQT